ncbi:hypothetical protein PoB_002725700 [Plakobranchus ocellatus]|uniref:Uncharacterized protein n=1 Tax=Plakobranchus ocellatus TaxID=259542 RepID=A0AAV4A1H4_9GAST|nr:hypothetical protein PoB_002725700 [Plakobranchus ocellatus]
MVSSPRIDFNSLWILKGDLSATFADPFKLITINFLDDDQFAEGDIIISVGRFSAFLLLATETAPRAAYAPSLRQDMERVFFLFLFLFFLVMEKFQDSAPGLPAHLGAQPKGHFAQQYSTVPGLPWSNIPGRGCGTSTGETRPDSKKTDQPIGQRGLSLPSRLGGPLLPGHHHINV